MKYALLAVWLFGASAARAERVVMESKPSTLASITVSSLTTQVAVGTTTLYGGAVPNVALFTTSNVVVGTSGCVLYSTGSAACPSFVGGGAGLTSLTAANVSAGSLGASVIASSVAATAVTSGSYGDGTHVGQFTVGVDGRLTAAAGVAITGAAPTGAAGGVLAGSYPSPTLGSHVVLSTHIANGAVGDAQTTLSTGAIAAGKFGDNRVGITTGAITGGFNGASQLVQLDANKAMQLSGSVTATTGTFTSNAFSVGGSSFSVSGGSATVAYAMTAGSFAGNATTASALKAAGSKCSSGNVAIGVDVSGNCIAGFVDTSATSGSTNTITSGAMFTALAGKQASGSYAASGANGDITSLTALKTISSAFTATSSMTDTSAGGLGVTYGVSAGTLTLTSAADISLVNASTITTGGRLYISTSASSSSPEVVISSTNGGSFAIGLSTFSVGVSTLVVTGGKIGIGSTNPLYPVFIHLTTNQNIGVRQNATSSEILAVNDDASSNAAMNIEGLPVSINSRTGNSVGIGTSSPGGRLEVDGSASTYTVVLQGNGTNSTSLGLHVLAGTNSSDVAVKVEGAINGNQYLIVRGDGNVGVGISPVEELHVKQQGDGYANGIRLEEYAAGGTHYLSVHQDSTDVTYFTTAASNHASLTNAGAWTNASDAAIKKNIVAIGYGLDAVMALQPRSYDMKAGGSHQIGFIAQEVQPVVPEVVSGKEGALGIAYGPLAAVLTKAIQEQQAEIKSLQARIAVLEAK